VALARGLREAPPIRERRTEPAGIGALVHGSGVLAVMMHESEKRLASAANLAHAIGARRLGMWAEQRATRALVLAGRKEKTPGYARRMRSIAPSVSEQSTMAAVFGKPRVRDTVGGEAQPAIERRKR
jgi:hypothetical protein